MDGIEAAHLMQIYHRDIKPENILINRKDGSLVVADFGIAHFNEDIQETTVKTKPDTKLANLGYASPEQRVPGSKITHQSDIFSLGLILNEMFTKEVPHGTGIKTISQVSPEHAYLDNIVNRMMQQNPSMRYSSIEDIKKELIGRKNEFIALQILDEKRKKVIPASDIPEFEEIKIEGVDYVDGQLVFMLNRVPEYNWKTAFRQPRENFTRLVNYGPDAFGFNGSFRNVGKYEQKK